MKVRLLCSMFILILLSCNDNENEYVETIVENNSQQERVVRCLVDGDSLYLTEVDGLLLFEGDIVVGQVNSLSRSASLTLESEKWPNNIVYYEFDSNYTSRSVVMSAMNYWQECTNIVFFPRNGQKNYITFFLHDKNNNSPVGMKGGQQYINLAKNGHNKGTVIHEIGHALGLYHEQSRKDRNTYITIHWENIKPGKEHNFDIYKKGLDVGSFDFNSIMLYSSFDFSSNDLPTMTKKDGSIFIGQREYLSPGDIDAVARRYPYIPMYGNNRWVSVPADYDGDGKTDLAVKTNDGYWLIDYAKNGYGKWDWIGASYGNENSIPVPADYDGDGKADLAIKNNISEWYIDYAANGFGGWDWQGSGYGNENSIPVPADYDGDGKADLAIKNNISEWYIDYAANGFGIWDWKGSGYGNQTCIPVPADYDGDGKADLSVKSYAGYWYIDYAANGFGIWDWTGTYRGNETAHPVPADYDGDGKVDLAVKTDAGYWYIDYSMNGFNTGWDLVLNYGGDATVHPVPADYDGDGKADIAIKADAGYWSIDYARNGFKTWDWSH